MVKNLLARLFKPKRALENSIMVLTPYRHNGMWVFDDPETGLVREPFVSGVPEILDALLVRQGVVSPETGFRLVFSASPFPGHQLKAGWLRPEFGGNWYGVDTPSGQVEGWLCPALYKYFSEAPKELYVRVESLS